MVSTGHPERCRDFVRISPLSRAHVLMTDFPCRGRRFQAYSGLWRWPMPPDTGDGSREIFWPLVTLRYAFVLLSYQKPVFHKSETNPCLNSWRRPAWDVKDIRDIVLSNPACVTLVKAHGIVFGAMPGLFSQRWTEFAEAGRSQVGLSIGCFSMTLHHTG